MTTETKKQRFQRLAEKRTNDVLERLLDFQNVRTGHNTNMPPKRYEKFSTRLREK